MFRSGKGRRMKEELTSELRSLRSLQDGNEIAVSSSHSCRKGASFSALTTPDSTSRSSK